MSEYPCYVLVALDRQLTSKEMAELRAISTRAEIARTRFVAEKAVELAVDLRELAERDGSLPLFEERFSYPKKAHARRRGLFDAFQRRMPEP